jgi:hypothetical protein
MAKTGGVRLATREQFVRAATCRESDVTLPEVGTIRIREFTTAQRLAYLEYLEVGPDGLPHFSPAKQVEFNKFIICMGLIDADGNPMFAPGDEMPDLRFDVLEALTRAILTLSGLVPGEAKDTPKNLARKTISVMPSPSS